MRYLVIGLLLLASSVGAEERVFGLDGSVYLLREGSYQKLPVADTAGRINFHFDAAQNKGEECVLRLVLTNSTDKTIRYLVHVFKAFTRRNNDTLWFRFGGSLDSDAVFPGEISEHERTFEKGDCQQIIEIEPLLRHGTDDPKYFHVDGLSASDTIRLFNYPDVGIFTITHSGG